jgi:transcriptional regulator of arginine metabolism
MQLYGIFIQRQFFMEQRNERHLAIKRIIGKRKVKSQEQLLEYLTDAGFSVTQATLSRDLKQLRVVKVSDGPGYAYAVLDHEESSEDDLVEDFLAGFLSIDFSGNLGVIKTLPGHAQSVALALDNLKLAQILGTIAGDDTILVVPRDRETRAGVLRALEKKIPGLKEEL